MDLLAFIASLIDSLAWPIAIVILVMALRSPLGRLLPKLSRFRYGEMEIDFGLEVRKLEDKAKNAGLRLPKGATPAKAKKHDSAQIITEATQLVSDFPEPAVGLAWTAVEHELSQAVMRLAISADYPLYNAALKNTQLLQRHGYLDDKSCDILNRMRNLRNAAVHPAMGSRVFADDAREFVALAEAMTNQLKILKR